MARQAIEAPPATPPLYSLLQAADVIDPADERWQQGVEWAPEQVFGGGAVAVDCFGSSPDGKPSADNPMLNTADPFAVFAEDHCTTLVQRRDYEGRARRQLAAVQSAFIAREFQLGEIRTAEGLDNVALIDAIEVGPGGGSGPVEEQIGILEAAMAAAYAGALGMIHVTTQTLVAMKAKNLIEFQGQKWRTPPGNIVVADAGYVAESPNFGVFAYGTKLVRVYLSGVDVPADVFESTDRATNLTTLIAERLAMVVVDHTKTDPADLFFKVEVDLEPWAIGS